MNMISCCQSKFSFLNFSYDQFDLKHKMLLVRGLLNIEISLTLTMMGFLGVCFGVGGKIIS